MVYDGKEKSTIHEVAQAAGVSIATVSRAFNHAQLVKDSTAHRVYTAAMEVGYQASAAAPLFLTEPGNRPILIVLTSIGNPFYSEIVKGISTAAARCNYQCLIRQVEDLGYSLSHFNQLLGNVAPAGVILMNCIQEAEILESLFRRIPIVQCCEYNEDSDVSFVTVNDASSAKMLIEYMVTRGKRNIALINGDLRYKYARKRQEGYLAGMKSCELPVNEEWVVQLSDMGYEQALSVSTQMLSRASRPDAIFAVSDVYAAAVIKAARRLNIKIPDDLGVIGFDNTDYSVLIDPSITTVNQPKYQMGYLACEILMERIMTPGLPNKHIFLDTELIIRESI